METYSLIPIGSGRSAKPEDIILLSAEGNYTYVHFANGSKLVVALTLKILEKRFANCSSFFRTHKSYLINLDYINHYSRTNKEGLIFLKYNCLAVVSRRKRNIFISRLKEGKAVV